MIKNQTNSKCAGYSQCYQYWSSARQACNAVIVLLCSQGEFKQTTSQHLFPFEKWWTVDEAFADKIMNRSSSLISCFEAKFHHLPSSWEQFLPNAPLLRQKVKAQCWDFKVNRGAWFVLWCPQSSVLVLFFTWCLFLLVQTQWLKPFGASNFHFCHQNIFPDFCIPLPHPHYLYLCLISCSLTWILDCVTHVECHQIIKHF